MGLLNALALSVMQYTPKVKDITVQLNLLEFGYNFKKYSSTITNRIRRMN